MRSLFGVDHASYACYVLPLKFASKDVKRRRKKKEETGKEHIFEKVQHSEWASPTALIVEANGDLRICGGKLCYHRQVSALEQYPVPISGRATD